VVEAQVVGATDTQHATCKTREHEGRPAWSKRNSSRKANSTLT
jgi:hypothetical protein